MEIHKFFLLHTASSTITTTLPQLLTLRHLRPLHTSLAPSTHLRRATVYYNEHIVPAGSVHMWHTNGR